MSIPLIITLLIPLLLIIYIITIHNRIIAYYNATQRAWADVITQQMQKNRLLPTLERMVEEYKIHEADLLQNITALRSSLKNIAPENSSVEQLREINNESKMLFSQLNMVAENYPSLKASEVYQKFMQELSELEKNVAASIRIFNANVETFNTTIELFPNLFINQLFTKKSPLPIFDDHQASSDFEYRPPFK